MAEVEKDPRFSPKFKKKLRKKGHNVVEDPIEAIVQGIFVKDGEIKLHLTLGRVVKQPDTNGKYTSCSLLQN